MGTIASREREPLWIAKLSSREDCCSKYCYVIKCELFGLLFNVIREPVVRVASCVVKNTPTYPINNCLFHSTNMTNFFLINAQFPSS